MAISILESYSKSEINMIQPFHHIRKLLIVHLKIQILCLNSRNYTKILVNIAILLIYLEIFSKMGRKEKILHSNILLIIWSRYSSSIAKQYACN